VVEDTTATVEVEGVVALVEVMEATALVVEVEVDMEPRDGKGGQLIRHVEIVEGEMGEVELL